MLYSTLYYSFLSNAFLTTSATVFRFIPFSIQYLEFIQSDSFLVPLLELQETQQRAIFSGVTMLASLIMCSHEASVFLDSLDDSNLIPQYTHTLSLQRTSFSNHSGIFQLFICLSIIATVLVDRVGQGPPHS